MKLVSNPAWQRRYFSGHIFCKMRPTVKPDQALTCYHCGEPILQEKIVSGEHIFCCQGCKLVYEILNEHQLCDYYELNSNPGSQQKIKVREDKFAFLHDEKTINQLLSYRDEKEMHVTFYTPQMHCSSCLYLLEHLYKLDEGVKSSQVNFTSKEVSIVFSPQKTSLRNIAELLTSIGYEPYISLHELGNKKVPVDRSMIYKVGIAGFAFGNIMLMSFPEYLGIDTTEKQLLNLFRWLNFVLSLPVFFYCSTPFYTSAIKSLRHKFLNIDAPIALAIIITFARSVWEVFTGTGSGYFDSMSGIVFFMLAGRIVQDKTYRQLSFERDYTSYFPIAATVLQGNQKISRQLPEIKTGDTLLIHSEELIPADGILIKGKALIDYSFVTGESIPVTREIGEMVYAGGKQKGANIEILTVREVTQSYLTRLWNRDTFDNREHEDEKSFVHLFSRYFTYGVFAIAIGAAIYWAFNDQSRLWPAVTAVFIVACPCALLLSNTFTNGNILRILGRNHFYLRNAQTIENIAGITHIIFDKTGTLTSMQEQDIHYDGIELTPYQQQLVANLAASSNHPLSRILAKKLGADRNSGMLNFKEDTGLGIQGWINEHLVMIGSSEYVAGSAPTDRSTSVYVRIDHQVLGRFRFSNHYRETVRPLLDSLKHTYKLSVLSGDNDSEEIALRKIFGPDAVLKFNQGPEDKLDYIRELQSKGEKVMMIGDGLNDAGALKQSDAGIAITESSNNFTPASDGILAAEKLSSLKKFIDLCVANKRIVTASFVLSILYNIIGLYFAVSGVLSPIIAAILMPSSSLSILLITFGGSNIAAWLKRL